MASGLSDPAPPEADRLASLLRGVPLFQTLDRVDAARLLGALEAVAAPAGTMLFEEDDPADALYLLESGSVRISVRTSGRERTLAELDAPAQFGELGVLLARRTSTARASTDVRAWKLPRERFAALARERPGVALAVATQLAELFERRQRELVGAPPPPPPRAVIADESPPRPRRLRARVAGAALAVGVPVALWWVPPPAGLDESGWRVLLVLAGAALAWLFDPVPDFVAALLAAASWGALGLASLEDVFSGFASSSWIIALGALALAAAMARSGLLFRAALALLRAFPPTHAGQVAALLVGGVLVTPFVPLATARVASVAPLAHELAGTLGYPPRSRAGAALGFAGLLGYAGFSSVFLTGLAMNFFVYELLPQADRLRFDWLTWLVSAAGFGVALLAGVALVLFVLFRPDAPPRATAERLRSQQRALGPLSRRERITAVAVAVLLVGLLSQPLHGIGAPWLAIAALAVAVGGGALERDRFRAGIDWGFLVLFGVLLGTGTVLQRTGVDRWIADVLVPLTAAVADRGALVLLVAAFVIACRLMLPRQPASLLLTLALVPAAGRLGVEPWLVAFVVLVSANTWLHPSQSDFLRLMGDVTRGELFTERQGAFIGVAFSLATLAALALSIPYWRVLGLL